MSYPLHAYRVGELYSPTRTRWPEATDYNYRGGGHELRLFLGLPSTREIEAVRTGAAEFALYVEQPVMVLMWRFGDAMPWSDQPFSIHLVPEDERVLPEPMGTSEPHALLSIVLIDASNGIIQALRAVTFGPAMTTALALAVREQAAMPFDRTAYDRQIAEIYRRYPTTSALRRVAQSRQRPTERG